MFNVETFQTLINKPLKVTGHDLMAGAMSEGIMFYGDKAVACTKEYMCFVELPYELLELPLFLPRDFVKEIGRFSGFEDFEFKYSANLVDILFEKPLNDDIVGVFRLCGLQLDRTAFPNPSVVTEQDFIDCFVTNPSDMLKKAQKLRILDKTPDAVIVVNQDGEELFLSSKETLIGNSLVVKLEPKEVLWHIETTPGFKLKNLIDVFSTFNSDSDVMIGCTDKENVFVFAQEGHKQYLISFRR